MTAEERELDKILRSNIEGYQDMPRIVKAGILLSSQKYALHIAKRAVDREIDEWEYPETRDDAEIMANRIRFRIKKLTEQK